MKKYCFVLNSFSLKKILAVFAISSMVAFSGTVFGQEANSEMKTDQNQTEQAVPEAAAGTSTDTPVAKPDGDYPPMMSIEYIGQFCAAWNADELMTKGLADSEWVDNDGDKGFKIIQLYRKDCPDSPHVEMQFERQDNKAMCVYAGKVENPELDRSADYEMFADTKRWIEIGNGDYGPMKAMMLGRLKFKGPKIEAMGNMGPFKNFLLLFGHFPSDPTVCP
ncbi:MAG: SCP2 sterol-binding domain-containing protein [Gammaproteobacteria bacterium]|nr:SCP2 sterol-binding domain-containing protein [Gammaproteobacteria bacterium]MDX2488008.1 SCP2 sterol-binding domain-containing protein [Gammaproteobacteria bacterium]